MSKPKGRRKPLHSEITSLRRSTDAAEAMPASVSEAGAVDDGTGAASPRIAEEEPAPRPLPSQATEPLEQADASEEPLRSELEPPAAEAAEAAPDSTAFAETLTDPFDPNAANARLPSNVVSIDGEEPDDMEAFLCGLIEALLFTSQKPLALKEIARAAGVDRPRARELLERLVRNYSSRGINLDEVAGGYVLRSSARYAPQIQKFLALRPVRLSRAQLETLAIVAYRQPVTKPEVDDIRGVDSGQVLKGLMERSLLKILGKKDEPGRPMLYGTTNDFLELLNLRSLGELPTLREYTELSEESRQKFADETGEDAPAEPLEPITASDTLATAGAASNGLHSETPTASGKAAAAELLARLEQDTGEPGSDEEAQASALENEPAPPEGARAAAKKEEEDESEKEEDDESDEDDDDDDDDESDDDDEEDDDEDLDDDDEEDDDEDLDDDDEEDDDEEDDESEEDKTDEKD